MFFGRFNKPYLKTSYCQVESQSIVIQETSGDLNLSLPTADIAAIFFFLFIVVIT